MGWGGRLIYDRALLVKPHGPVIHHNHNNGGGGERGAGLIGCWDRRARDNGENRPKQTRRWPHTTWGGTLIKVGDSCAGVDLGWFTPARIFTAPTGVGGAAQRAGNAHTRKQGHVTGCEEREGRLEGLDKELAGDL